MVPRLPRFAAGAALAVVAAVAPLAAPAFAQDATPAAGTPDPSSQLVFRAGVFAGTCDELGENVYPLTEPGYGFVLVPGGPASGTPPVGEARVVGAAAANPAATSVSTIPATIDQLTESPHAINVYGLPDDAGSSVCGGVGGVRVGDELAFGVQEQNGTGYAGIAHLRENPDGTITVSLYLASGLAAGLAAGEAGGAAAQPSTTPPAAATGVEPIPTAVGGDVVATDREAIPDASPTALDDLPDDIEEATIAVAGGAFAADELILLEGEPTVLHVDNRDDLGYRLAIGDLVPLAPIAANAVTDVQFTTPNAVALEGQLLAADGDEVLDTLRVVVQAPGGVAP